MSEWEQIGFEEFAAMHHDEQLGCRVRFGGVETTVNTVKYVDGSSIWMKTDNGIGEDLRPAFLAAIGGVIERPALPKPKIPTGLGAVVEIDGDLYVLADPADYRQAWLRRRSTSREWVSDTAMQVICDKYGFTVLSEGVSVDE